MRKGKCECECKHAQRVKSKNYICKFDCLVISSKVKMGYKPVEVGETALAWMAVCLLERLSTSGALGI
jgi:hypothetical protein